MNDLCADDSLIDAHRRGRGQEIAGTAVREGATTQLYFPDEVTNAVYARDPYDRNSNRDTTNASRRRTLPDP